MNWRRIGIGLVIVAGLSIAGYFGYQQFLAPQPADENATGDVNDVAITTDLDQVSAEGEIVPLENARLTFLTTGQIAELLVAEGDEVAAGDALLRLDTTDQEIAVIQAETAVTQAAANLQAAEAGLQAATIGVTAAEVGVAAAEAQLALLTADPTAAQVAISEAGVAVAEAGVVQAAGSRGVVLEGANSAQIRAAEVQLAAAQAELFSVRLANEPVAQNEDLDDDVREQAALRLSAAQQSVTAAQSALDELLAGASDAERLAASSGVSAAANQQTAAEARLDLLLAGAKPEQVTVTEVTVTQAEAAVVEAELRVAQAETAVAQAEAALVEAEAGLEAAQIALSQRTLTAPFGGVVASLPVKVGEVANAGTPVAILADFSQWHIETTDLTELGVVNIARGFEVEITIDAFPGETLRGEVVDIATSSAEVRGDVTYVTKIALNDDGGLPLRWGMTAFVTVETNQ